MTDTTPNIEQKAKELFWAQSTSWTGQQWDWDQASDQVKNKFRQHASKNTRPWSNTDMWSGIQPGKQNTTSQRR